MIRKEDYIKKSTKVYEFQFKNHNKKFIIPQGQFQYHKKNFIKYFKLKENQISKLNILDTGCGPGTHSTILALMGFKNILALDLLKKNIDIGNKRKRHYNLRNLKFKRYDLTKKISFKNKFDLISCHNWLQHTPDPKKIIFNLLQNLKIGGKIYISTYTADTFRHFISTLARNILKNINFNDFIKTIIKKNLYLCTRYINVHIGLRNMTDDFFTPYIHTTSYKYLAKSGKHLGIKKITKTQNYQNVDMHQLKLGFIKQKEIKFKKYKLHNFFFKNYSEFTNTKNKYKKECIKLSRQLLVLLNKKNNEFKILTAFKIYQLRAKLFKNNKKYNRYKYLKKFLINYIAESIKN